MANKYVYLFAGGKADGRGDIFLAFTTANRTIADNTREHELRMLSDDYITPLYYAVIDATEEAILNALLAAETMTGRDGHTAHALSSKSGPTRVVWRAGDGLPTVQCVQVRRTGNVLAGMDVTLTGLSAPIEREASC